MTEFLALSWGATFLLALKMTSAVVLAWIIIIAPLMILTKFLESLLDD